MQTIRRILETLILGVLLACALPALAQSRGNHGGGGGQHPGPPPGRPPTHTRTVPEFDPATAGAIAAVVVGGTVLLVRRRKT